MREPEKKRKFVLEFFQQISGQVKTELVLKPYSSDPKLIEHLLFWEQLFPEYKLLVEEVTTEEERVIVRGHTSGKHTGTVMGVTPTHKRIEIPFALGLRINRGKITEHWFVSDQFELLEQLGLIKPLPAHDLDKHRGV